MKWLTIDYIKQHSRIEYDCEDSLLELYGEAAEESVADYLNRGKTVDDCAASLIEEYGKIPARIIQASLMLVDTSYQYRSPVSPTQMYQVHYSFDYLVKPFIWLADHHAEPAPADGGVSGCATDSTPSTDTTEVNP